MSDIRCQVTIER